MATGKTVQGEKLPKDLIDSFQKQGIKTYSVYDGSNRLIEYYEADLSAVTGYECLKTTYAYDGASSRVQKTKEELSTWDSGWDI